MEADEPRFQFGLRQLLGAVLAVAMFAGAYRIRPALTQISVAFAYAAILFHTQPEFATIKRPAVAFCLVLTVLPWLAALAIPIFIRAVK